MGWWRRRPLSFQLVVIVVVLGGLSLAAAGTVAAVSLRNYLIGQIDQQLLTVSGAEPGGGPQLPRPGGEAFRPTALRTPAAPHTDDDDHGLPAEFYVAVRTPDGAVQVLSRPYGSGAPDLSAVPNTRGVPVTVPGDGGSWRLVARSAPQGTVYYAKPLAEVDQTVARLAIIEAVIGGVVLALLAVLAFFAIRRSLRPLAEVEATAGEIAGGDLSRRVPLHEPTTEVGQLSLTFNTMLDGISRSMDERDAALRESRASEERMRRFVADASHELRTPLTTIRGYSELFRQGAIPAEKVPETFGRVEGESQRMGALVDDLLLLARLDQQRPLESGRVDLLELTNDVVQGARVRLGDDNRRIRLRPEGPGVPVVVGDQARLHQVVANLVANAIKYGAGDVSVEVDGRTAGWVRIGVADQGPGIPDTDKQRIFERFYRGDPSRTRAAGGTGLGLSIVQAIVTRHGGSVSVRDNADGGATFDVWLPAAPE
ncbi:MAG: HAMP domain-containing sensor histidine kinase [Candidatus Nanopelagicales bacterium]